MIWNSPDPSPRRRRTIGERGSFTRLVPVGRWLLRALGSPTPCEILAVDLDTVDMVGQRLIDPIDKPCHPTDPWMWMFCWCQYVGRLYSHSTLPSPMTTISSGVRNLLCLIPSSGDIHEIPEKHWHVSFWRVELQEDAKPLSAHFLSTLPLRKQLFPPEGHAFTNCRLVQTVEGSNEHFTVVIDWKASVEGKDQDRKCVMNYPRHPDFVSNLYHPCLLLRAN